MRTVIHPHYHTLESFIRQLPATFEQEGEVLWAGRNTVKQYTVNGTPLVVKRFKRPNIVQRIAYTFFKKSKAERAYLYAGLFRERGIDTPHEVAFIEEKHGGLLRDSYFVSLPCPDANLYDLLHADNRPQDVVNALAGFLVVLHRKGILHGDLNLTNILYRPSDNGYHFSLIDNNRSTFVAHPSQEVCLKNMVRLTHNRELLAEIITQYVRIVGWDASACITRIMQLQDEFERHKKRVGYFKTVRKIICKK